MPNLVESIKTAAVEAIEGMKPCAVMFGTVISSNPLKINVEQKMTLTSAQLVLTRHVTDHKVEMTVDHTTEQAADSHTHPIDAKTDTFAGETDEEEDHTHKYSHEHSVTGQTSPPSSSGHSHAYRGRKTFTVHNGLSAGDEVILLRQQGGQKFIVLDRIG